MEASGVGATVTIVIYILGFFAGTMVILSGCCSSPNRDREIYEEGWKNGYTEGIGICEDEPFYYPPESKGERL